MGYTPLYDTMLTGTLYGRWPHTGIWACLLSRASREGVIDETPQSLAAAMGIDLQTLLSCIHDFMQPDPDSRTTEHEGRRLTLIDPKRSWGWKVLNHGKYREKSRKQNYDEKRTTSGEDAERKRQERESRDVPTHPDASRDVPLSEAKALRESTAPRKRSPTKTQIPEDFTLTPEREAQARRSGIANPAAEFENFRDYYRGKGTAWKSWDIAWGRWCGRSKQYGKTSNKSNSDVYRHAK